MSQYSWPELKARKPHIRRSNLLWRGWVCGLLGTTTAYYGATPKIAYDCWLSHAHEYWESLDWIF